MAKHWANGPTACFDHLEECFSYIEVEFREFSLAAKSFLLKTLVKPLMCESCLTMKIRAIYLL